jgi:hypothetical protein
MLRVNALIGFGRGAGAAALPFGLYLLGSGSGTSSSTTVALTTTRAAPAGSTIVVLFGLGGGSTGSMSSVGDGGTNTYTVIAASGSYCRMFHKQNASLLPAGSTITGTFSSAATDRAIIAAYISGAAAASADVNSIANGSTGGMNSGSTSSLAQANEIFVGGVIHSSAQTLTEDSNYSTLETIVAGTARLNMASRIVSTASGRNYRPSGSGALSNWTSIASSYKAA